MNRREHYRREAIFWQGVSRHHADLARIHRDAGRPANAGLEQAKARAHSAFARSFLFSLLSEEKSLRKLAEQRLKS